MHRIVVMGVSGCGKTTLARMLADRLGLRFIEGDDCHPPANVAKMRAGIPLDDADRQPFLDAVARALAAAPGGAVASCSALRRAYRDRIRAIVPDVRFVLPVLDGAALHERLAARAGHFMPPSLLASQLATLEPPQADEDALVLDGARPAAVQADEALAFIDKPLPPGKCARSHLAD